MENSYEAIYTGVYLFVFVAALTIALYLFQGVNDLADRSYDYGKVVEGNAVIETDAEEKKYLSKEDVISYYMNYIKKDNYDENNDDKELQLPVVEIDGINTNNLEYSELLGKLSKKNYYITKSSTSNKFIIKSVE